MPKPREPINLIIAKGKKHLGKDEIEKRRSQELQVPFTNVEPPEYLTAKQQGEFNAIAEKLVALDIFTELDIDALARYIIARDLYLSYTKKLNGKLRAKEADLGEIKALQGLQEKAHRQCVVGANELCLNITSRAKLVIPQPPQEDESLWD